MKKILHIITRFDRGGSSEDVVCTYAYLKGKGYDVKVVYGRTDYPSAPFAKENSANPADFMLVRHLVRAINPLFDLIALARIYTIIAREKPDILHTHTSKAGIIGRWAGWLYKKLSGHRLTILHSTYGHVFYGYYPGIIARLFVLVEKVTASVTDTIITLTRNEAEEHLRYGVGRAGQFAVVHSGIDDRFVFNDYSLRERLEIPGTALIIGSVGRLEPVKGYRYLIEAFRLVETSRPDLRCVYLLVGDGNERAALELQCRKRAFRNKIIFAGWQENVADFTAAIDIFVQPSLNEGLGKTVVMAQMLRRPVIATNVQGLVSIIKDGETGLLVPPADAVSLAAAILRLIDDAPLRLKLAVAAQQRVLQRDPASGLYRFSVEYMNYLCEKIYER
jgi:glycosyltransferase involved in cell wall biosynthesis